MQAYDTDGTTAPYALHTTLEDGYVFQARSGKFAGDAADTQMNVVSRRTPRAAIAAGQDPLGAIVEFSTTGMSGIEFSAYVGTDIKGYKTQKAYYSLDGETWTEFASVELVSHDIDSPIYSDAKVWGWNELKGTIPDAAENQDKVYVKIQGDKTSDKVKYSDIDVSDYDMFEFVGNILITYKSYATPVNKYRLTYTVDGEVYQQDSVAAGDAITPIAEPDAREGYTFSGWSETPDVMPDEDVTIAGTFKVNVYPLTYIVDGETYYTTSFAYGTAVTPIAAPVREGYTFSGWQDMPATMPAGDVTVTGTFVVNSYVIAFVADSITVSADSVAYGASITAPDAPVREGYEFDGWQDVPSTMPAHDVTVIGTYTKVVVPEPELGDTIAPMDTTTVTEVAFESLAESVEALADTVVDNVYYALDVVGGDTYDVEEECIVMQSVTSDDVVESLAADTTATPGTSEFAERYTGIVFELAAGTGSIAFDLRTQGDRALAVKVGAGSVVRLTSDERGVVELDYDCAEPTYVYVYGTTDTKLIAMRRTADVAASTADGTVRLYGFTVRPGIPATSIGRIAAPASASQNAVYDLGGRRMPAQSGRGLRIVNGRTIIMVK